MKDSMYQYEDVYSLYPDTESTVYMSQNLDYINNPHMYPHCKMSHHLRHNDVLYIIILTYNYIIPCIRFYIS